ncbi:unnamed protein product [Phaeothamnion confervicola]
MKPQEATNAGDAGPLVDVAVSTSAGPTVAALISEGVKIENWLCGIQHRLLLGVAPARELSVPARLSVGGPVANGTAAGTAAVVGPAGKRAGGVVGSGECPGGIAKGDGLLWRRFDVWLAYLREQACLHPGFLERPYFSRLAFAALFFCGAAYLNALATMVSTRRNPYNLLLDLDGNPLTTHTLPDLGHDLWAFVLRQLGHHTDYIDEHHLPDTWVALLARTTCIFGTLHPRRCLVWRRTLVIFGCLLLLRAVSVSVTVLPDASPVCRAQFGSSAGLYKAEQMFPRVFAEAAAFAVAPRGAVSCGDMVFSGHTTCLMVFAMVFRKYCRAKHLQTRLLRRLGVVTERTCTLARRAVYVYCVAGFAVIIGSKLHYTLDVLLAVLLSYWTFRMYHDWVRYGRLRKKARILSWLEADEVVGLDNAVYARAQRPPCPKFCPFPSFAVHADADEAAAAAVVMAAATLAAPLEAPVEPASTAVATAATAVVAAAAAAATAVAAAVAALVPAGPVATAMEVAVPAPAADKRPEVTGGEEPVMTDPPAAEPAAEPVAAERPQLTVAKSVPPVAALPAIFSAGSIGGAESRRRGVKGAPVT